MRGVIVQPRRRLPRPWVRDLAERLEVGSRTCLALLTLPPALVVGSLWALALSGAGAARTHVDRVYTGFARFCLRVAGTRLVVRGLGHIKPGHAYIVVPNHESDWDPIVLLAALARLPMRFVAKRQLMELPILGRALARTGNVSVDRRDTSGDADRIQAGMAARPRDVSIIFYAEGTRARDGAFHPFKKGAFAAAIANGLAILPIGTAGSYRIWRPLTAVIRPGTIVVEVGTPIPVEDLQPGDIDWLRNRTYAAVGDLRLRARRRLRALEPPPDNIGRIE